jgi:hypothetical protein
MISTYNAYNWFWIVGGDKNRAWSSAAAAYVAEWPDDRVTSIGSEAELREVLANAGLPKQAPGYVPQSVYMWQAKTALAAIGKLPQVDDAIDASGNPALMVAWHTAPYISRSSEAVSAIGAIIGLDAKATDALFIQADTYKV